MAKQEKTGKGGFVIKLSTETVQKIADEEQQAKELANKKQSDVVTDNNLNSSVEHGKTKPKISKELSKLTNKETISDKTYLAPNTSKQTSLVAGETPASWNDYASYITYEGDEAVYTDPSTQLKYTWDNSNNSWVPRPDISKESSRTYSFENDKHVYTETDGSKCFWDEDKKAWIPQVDDEFLANYQMSYGFVDNTSKEEEKELNKGEDMKLDQAGVKRKAEPQWFEQTDDKNTKVYVSNLPQDITEEEFVDFMQKCGLVMKDPSTQKMKIKLYTDKEHNCFKGDALCTYIKIESVELALKILDGSELKGNKVRVERAQFQLKGEYNPALKPKKKKKKELEKIKKMQEKLFDWRPEKFVGERSKHERIVIIKNVFHPTDFDKEVQLILDYQQDLREECGKCGEVRKVTLYDRHPEGVAQVTMKEPEEADAVVTLINGRWFGKRQLTAEIWDGKTKFKIAETDADINQRIKKWDKFLEQEDKSESKKVNIAETDTEQAMESKDQLRDTEPSPSVE